MAEPVRHRRTKGAATDTFSLQQPRHTSTHMGDPLSRTIYTSWSASFLVIGSEGLSPFQSGTGPHLLTFGRAPPVTMIPHSREPGSRRVGSISMRRRVVATSRNDRHPLGSGGSFKCSIRGFGTRALPQSSLSVRSVRHVRRGRAWWRFSANAPVSSVPCITVNGIHALSSAPFGTRPSVT